MKRHLLSFNTFAVDEVLLRVLDSFSFLLEEHRQWRVKEWKYINNLYIQFPFFYLPLSMFCRCLVGKEASLGRNQRSHCNQQLII